MATKNIVPRTGSQGQLGTDAKPWKHHIADSGSFELISGSLTPDAADTYDLGTASKFWRDLYVSSGSIKFIDPSNNKVITTLGLDSDGNQKISGSFLPDADNTYDLGSSGKEWKDLYIDGTANIDSLTLSSGATVTAVLDEDAMGSDSATSLATQQSIKKYVDDTVTAEDLDVSSDSGTIAIDLDSETFTIAGGTGITTSATSNTLTITSAITAGDGLTLTTADIDIDAAQTTITSIKNASLVIGRDSDNDIDFATDNNIIFRAGGEDQLTLVDGALTPSSNAIVDLGTDALEFKDAYFDGTVEADAITIAGVTLSETIADTVGAMVSSNTETNIAVTYEDSDNTLDFVIGTLNQDTTGTADNITVSANNSTDETVYPIFVDGATGSQGAETDTGLTYNPSSGELTSTSGSFSRVELGDSEILSIGDGNDLQIYHGGSNSVIQDAGTGGLIIRGSEIKLIGNNTSDEFIVATENGSVDIYYDDSKKLETTSAGVTVTGTLAATSLDISGDVDVDGTLEADAYTVDGTTLATYIRDTVGSNMLSSNTESGITVTYDTSNDNIDFAIDAAQTGITSLLATDIKIGEDDQTKIDFETANTINFYADNEKQLILTDGALTPGADNILDLGSSGVEFKDGFFDGTVTSDAFAGPLTGDVTGNADTATALASGRTIGMTGDVVWTSPSFDGSGNVTAAATIQATSVENSMLAGSIANSKLSNSTISGIALGSNLADLTVDNTTIQLSSGTTYNGGTALTISGKTAAIANGGSGLATADQIHTFVTTQTDSIAASTSGTAAKVTVSDDASNNNWPIVLHDGSNALLDDTGTFYYNPSTATMTVTNLNVEGSQSFVDQATLVVTSSIQFEGATADGYETTLTVVDPTADRTITLPNATDTVTLNTTSQTLTNKTLTSPDINTPDIDGGTVDAITSLTVANNVDIGSYDLRAHTLTSDTLTSGRVVFATTNGQLDDDADFTFSTDTLTVTKLGAYEQAGSVNFSDEAMTNVNIDSGAIDGTNITVGSGKTLDVSGGTLTLAADQISGNAINGGTIGSTTITSLTTSGITLGGHAVDDIDITSEASDADDHLMTAAAIKARIDDLKGVTSNVAGTGISVSGATGAVTITNTGVTSNVAGSGIDVSGATGAVTISIGTGEITHAMLGGDIIDGDNIGDNVINSEHYAAGSIDNEHLADDAVDSDELAAGAVDDAHLSDGVATGLAGTGMTATSGVLNVIGGTGITANANDIAITADSVGDTQLEYNTGQHLTTSSSPTFAGGTINSTTGFTINSTTGGGAPRLWLYDYTDDNESANIQFHKSKGGSYGSHGAVVDGTDIGRIAWYASDGNSWEAAADILIEIDGSPGDGDVPGRMIFRTTADGSSATTERMRIDSAGDVKIVESLGVGATPSSTTGRIDASNDVVAYSSSDKRWKENLIRISDPLEKIGKISGYEFDWKELDEEEKKTQHGNTGHDIGVIAQEIQEVLPEVVSERDNGYLGVKYEKIVPLLIESIKELKAEIEELKKKN